MGTYIENAMLECIERRYLLPTYGPRDKKVAVIGEERARIEKDSFPADLIKYFSVSKKNITVYTKRKKFEAKHAKNFDILIGVRPCGGETEILKGAKKYNKKFILMPCTCGGLQVKMLKLIREYPVIEKIEAIPGRYNDGKWDSRAWMILYN